MNLILLVVSAYLIGSVNVSIGLFRLLGREDPRTHFSGNPGMTNIYRQAGIGWALVVLLLETGKAMVLAVASIYLLPTNLIPCVGLGLVIGNLYPCFHHFKGGKGVANYLGFTIPIAPFWAITAMATWPIAFGTTRKPFIGSFIMVVILTTGITIYCGLALLALGGSAATVAIIFYAHRQNVIEHLARKNEKT